jgi:hypothetical protein
MGLKVFSQLDYAEKGGLIDDCGPSALAAAIYHSSNGAQNPGVDGCILAAAKAGRRDTNGKSEGTTFVQIVAAAKFVNATLTVAPNWTKAVAAMKTGKAVCVAFRAPIATPKNAISAWQKRSMKRRPGHTYAHYATLAIVDGQFVFADPTMSGKDAEQFGVIITEAEAKTLAHWGIAEVNAKRSTPMAWICATKTVAPAPVPVAPAPVAVAPIVAPAPVAVPVAVASLDEHIDTRLAAAPTIAVEAPTSHAKEVPVTKKTKTAAVIADAEAAMLRVDWDDKGKEAINALVEAAKASNGKKGFRAKVGASFGWIIANTGIDEMVIEALRTGLGTGLAIALASGSQITRLDADQADMIFAGAIAACLQVIVRALNPDDPKFGVGKAKAEIANGNGLHK